MHRARSGSNHRCSGTTGEARYRGPVWLGLVVAVFVAGGILVSALPAPAEAVTPDTATTTTIRLYGEVQTQVDDLTIQAGFVQSEIDTLDEQLEQTSEAYNRLQVQMDQLYVRMTQLRRDLSAAQDDRAYRMQKYENRLRELYKAGGSDQFLDLLFSAKDISDFISRLRLAANQADQDRSLVENLKESSERLSDVLAQLDEAKAQELDIRQQMRDQQDDMEVKLEERKATLADLDDQIATIIEQERKRQEEEQARLQAALQAIINGGSVYQGPLPQTDSEVVNQFLETAATYIGIPYVWGGDRPSTGMDCSGFTRFVYMQHGVDLPHYSGYQAQMGIPVDYANIQPGDLVAFGSPVHHVGIYIGDDLFIHAPGTGDAIKIGHLSSRSDLTAIRRFDLQPRTGAPAIY